MTFLIKNNGGVKAPIKKTTMKTLTYLESAQYELEQLNFWFKMNKGQQGTDEWNNNIERGIDLSETVNNL